MKRLNMQTSNKVNDNIKKIEALFPNCITENIGEDGKPKKIIDFSLLKQELSDVVVDGDEGRYQFTWADKKKSILLANSPINKTLRPCREESVNFDTTKNLYIEGDNLDVLKLLQETYMDKVKMIYIAPPYNTGNDFIYSDDFSIDKDIYREMIEDYDEDENRLFLNTDSNGRFHTDWLNMIYPRLKLARDFLTDDGVIFISIDDNEVHNLRKICDEIFGIGNMLAIFNWQTKNAARGVPPITMVMENHEYIICYGKNISNVKFKGIERNESDFANPDNDPRGLWRSESMKATGGGGKEFKITNPINGRIYLQRWAFSKERIDEMIKENLIIFPENDDGVVRQKKFINSYLNDKKAFVTNLGWYSTENATKIFMDLFNNEKLFDFSKPTELIKFLINQSTNFNSVIFDFFSGSATTAHAVMQLNAEDGGTRKFIMIQLPEETPENSEARKSGYKNICEIGKERIRHAGKKIINENPLTTQNLDIGFRVLKLDSSNMKSVFYNPEELTQDMLEDLVDNIKEDRTPEDLLFQVMLDMGIELSSLINVEIINGKKIFIVGEGIVEECKMENAEYKMEEINYELVCCFDKNITKEIVMAIAKKKPLYAVFRDNSFASDDILVSFEQLFETFSPMTERRVI